MFGKYSDAEVSEVEARFCWCGDGLPAVSVSLCGAVKETVAHFVTKWRVCGAGGLEQFGVSWQDALEEILMFGEDHHIVGGDVEEEKKRSGSTNAETSTSVVRACRGADKKAEPEEHRRVTDEIK